MKENQEIHIDGKKLEAMLDYIDTDWIEDNPNEARRLLEDLIKDNIKMYDMIQFYKATLALAQDTYEKMKKRLGKYEKVK